MHGNGCVLFEQKLISNSSKFCFPIEIANQASIPLYSGVFVLKATFVLEEARFFRMKTVWFFSVGAQSFSSPLKLEGHVRQDLYYFDVCKRSSFLC